MIDGLVDIGANLTHDSFDADRDDVIARAREAGVDAFVITGSSESGSRAALDLARSDPTLYRATAGVHPHHASDWSGDVASTLRELLNDPLTVAVGECGLDYFRNFSPQDDQRRAFGGQLDIAAATGKPVFLHQRDAHEDFVELLGPRLGELSGGVAHCFTGDAGMLAAYLELGLHIGITGWICDERRGRHLMDIVADIPLERLMIETDAPYLLPRSLSPKPKSRRNEPAYLTEVLRVIAECRPESKETIAEATTRNARRLFGFQ